MRHADLGATGAGVRSVARLRPSARAWPVVAALAAFAVVFAWIARAPAVRVGDGSEYYGLFFAWRDSLRPFMSASAWAAYDAFVASHRVGYMVPTQAMKEAFPALTLGQTADFNHFWFYSFFPAVVARAIAPLAHPSAQAMFLVFHWGLTAIPLVLGWRYFKWSGLLAVAVLLLLSPIIWYFNKVHTELFTVCTVLSAVVLFRAGRLLGAAFFVALASTQNVSFLAIAGVVVALDLVRRRGRPQYTRAEAALLIATAFAIALHPMYYFFRLGALTPQFVAGGAAVGSNLGTFYLWFVDPDLGLLPNWPLIVGLALLAIAARAYRPRVNLPVDRRAFGAWTVFVVVYLAVNLLAQSSTQNLNSGASPGLARYALWYIPLFFPLVRSVIAAALPTVAGPPPSAPGAAHAGAWIFRGLLIAVLAAGAVDARTHFRPALTEAGSFRPSWASAFLQRHLPTLYTPPAEVWVERFGGIGEDARLVTARAVVGPDCRKMLVRGAENTTVFGGAGCLISESGLRDVLNARPDAAQGPFPHFVRLTEEERIRTRLSVPLDQWNALGSDSRMFGVLASGWGSGEPWGVWSADAHPALMLPCAAAAPAQAVQRPTRVDLVLRPFLAAGHDRIDVHFAIVGQPEQRTTFRLPEVGEQTVSLAVSPDACVDGVITVTMAIDAPASPASLGLSEDPRVLGVGLSRFRLATSG